MSIKEGKVSNIALLILENDLDHQSITDIRNALVTVGPCRQGATIAGMGFFNSAF